MTRGRNLRERVDPVSVVYPPRLWRKSNFSIVGVEFKVNMYALIAIISQEREVAAREPVALFDTRIQAEEYAYAALNNPPVVEGLPKWETLGDPTKYRRDSVLRSACGYDVEYAPKLQRNPVLEPAKDENVVEYYTSEPATDTDYNSMSCLVAVTRSGKRICKNEHYYVDASKNAAILNKRFGLEKKPEAVVVGAE